jgi:predicted nucleotidyltransferase
MNIETQARDMILEIVDKIKKEYQPSKIILFGSYAYGQPDRDSDVDLLIVKDTSERFIDRLVAVTRITSDPKRLIPLEVIVFTPEEVREKLKSGDQFLREILSKGEVLYEV